MYYSGKRSVQKLTVLMLVLLWLSASAVGQTRGPDRPSIESLLSQETSFVPKSTSTLERLTEVARHSQVPMGIEWVGQLDTRVPKPLYSSRRTVRSLIEAILQQVPGYRARVQNGVLTIARTATSDTPKNFLNVRIPEFQVDRANLYDANALLRSKIKMTLHPERYTGGVGGGYGHAATGEPSFDEKSITFSGRNLTVREILNKIIALNGNALWVVQLVPSKRMTGEPFFAQGPLDEAGRPLSDFHWQFVSLDKVKTRLNIKRGNEGGALKVDRTITTQ
jgi:hypothetical protein